jgi:hypothetical protein
VKLQPTGRGFASAFSFRIRDARGAFVVDCYRGGGFASQSGPGPFSFLVAPGSYTAEIHADHFKTGRADFIATDGVVVPVEMVRDEK